MLHIQSDRKSLLAALDSVALVARKNSKNPILRLALVEADAEGVTVSGTDLDSSVRARVHGATVAAPGKVLLPIHDARAFLKASEGDTVDLAVTRDFKAGRPDVVQEATPTRPYRVVVEQGTPDERGEVVLTVAQAGIIRLAVEADPSDFPALCRALPTDTVATVDAAALRAALERVLPAVAKDAGRYAMHGMLLELEGSRLQLAGTDGRRMGLEAVVADRPEDVLPAKVILPRDAAAALVKLLGRKARRVALRFDPAGGHVVAEVESDHGGTVVLAARPLDGEFPRYRAVKREEHSTSVRAPAPELLRCLKAAAAGCADKDSRVVRLEVEGDALSLVGGGCSVAVPGATVERLEPKGAPAPLALSADYLADALKACGAEAARIRWRAKGEACEVDAGGFHYWVMPVTVE